MKKVIQFTKVRYAMITLSVILILGGVGSFFARGGFNLGIDFTGGLNKQFQIAQTAFSLSYNGAGRAEVFIVGKKLEITFSGTEQPGTKTFSFAAYPSLSRLVDALMEIPGMNAELVGNPETPPASILSLNFPIDITGARLVVNHGLDPESEIYASIHKVREALAALGSFSIQLVGNPINQEFILKVPTPRDADKEFLQRIDSQIEGLLADAFGKDQIISKKTDFVDPVFSIDLVRGAIWSIVV
ncbi:MAG TPA: hypothetical protein VMX75_01935, partial [Spirochaetia bacterium]|nr:hypothetical protein [Spirochaetia bacterium]